MLPKRMDAPGDFLLAGTAWIRNINLKSENLSVFLPIFCYD
jgi:hypothetical protein